jgi:hypothetical protein
MNASIVSLLLATTSVPGSADVLAFDGSAVPTSLAAPPPASLPAPLPRTTTRPGAARVLQERIDCTFAARRQAPDAALLFMRDTRYALG